MPLDWIFFDAGNTLIGLDYGLVARALRERGLRVTEAALRDSETAARRDLDEAIARRWYEGRVPRTGWVEAEVWRRYWGQVLVGCGAPPARAEELVDTVLEVTRPAASWDRVDPSTPGLLEELAARRLRLGIISNSNGTLKAHLRRLGLESRFDVIVDSSEAGVEKPHPEIFDLALRLAGGACAERSFYVGDVYAIDVLGASGAGIRAALFDPTGRGRPSSLPAGAPDPPVIRRLTDLLRLPEVA